MVVTNLTLQRAYGGDKPHTGLENGGDKPYTETCSWGDKPYTEIRS